MVASNHLMSPFFVHFSEPSQKRKIILPFQIWGVALKYAKAPLRAALGNRTPDLLITSEMLYQLS